MFFLAASSQVFLMWFCNAILLGRKGMQSNNFWKTGKLNRSFQYLSFCIRHLFGILIPNLKLIARSCPETVKEPNYFIYIVLILRFFFRYKNPNDGRLKLKKWILQPFKFPKVPLSIFLVHINRLMSFNTHNYSSIQSTFVLAD